MIIVRFYLVVLRVTLTFIRQIDAIEGKTVHYHDQYSSWSCFDSSFVQACPTVATPADEARVAEEVRKLARRG